MDSDRRHHHHCDGVSGFDALWAVRAPYGARSFTAAAQEAGTGYEVLQTIAGGLASTSALQGSTEAEQFH